MTHTVLPGTAGYGWRETYVGGSLTTENELNRELGRRMQHVQTRIRRRANAPGIRRAQHAKLLVGITDAEFRVCTDPPGDLRGEFFAPGARYPATVRFSNGNGVARPDGEPDLRGIAVRVRSPAGDQDFLATNAPASHARDPQQFLIVAEALAGPRPLLVPRLLLDLGVVETIRILRVLRGSTSRRVGSLATEVFWGRCPVAFGGVAVKYAARPSQPPEPAPVPGDDYLRDELVQRLKRGPVTFGFGVQRFVDERTTPIEDVVTPWDEGIAPVQALAELVLPQQDLEEPAGQEAQRAAEQIDYNPWNCVPGIRPIGRMSRARRQVYEASVAYRKAT